MNDAREEVRILPRLRYLVLFLLLFGLATASLLQGKSAPVDIMIQSTTDVYAELAPCG